MAETPRPNLAALRRAAIRTAHRTEIGLRDGLRALARRRGWTPAVIPYSGYAGPARARVLGRLMPAPPQVDPAARRGVPGWRRLLTLESPGQHVVVRLGGAQEELLSDAAGMIEVVLETDLPPGTTEAEIAVAGRRPVPAHVHVTSPAARVGLVCDIDDRPGSPG